MPRVLYVHVFFPSRLLVVQAADTVNAPGGAGRRIGGSASAATSGAVDSGVGAPAVGHSSSPPPSTGPATGNAHPQQAHFATLERATLGSVPHKKRAIFKVRGSDSRGAISGGGAAGGDGSVLGDAGAAGSRGVDVEPGLISYKKSKAIQGCDTSGDAASGGGVAGGGGSVCGNAGAAGSRGLDVKLGRLSYKKSETFNGCRTSGDAASGGGVAGGVDNVHGYAGDLGLQGLADWQPWSRDGTVAGKDGAIAAPVDAAAGQCAVLPLPPGEHYYSGRALKSAGSADVSASRATGTVAKQEVRMVLVGSSNSMFSIPHVVAALGRCCGGSCLEVACWHPPRVSSQRLNKE